MKGWQFHQMENSLRVTCLKCRIFCLLYLSCQIYWHKLFVMLPNSLSNVVRLCSDSLFSNLILFTCTFFFSPGQLAKNLSILLVSKNQLLAISWILLFLHMLRRAFHISAYTFTSFFFIATTVFHIMGVLGFI